MTQIFLCAASLCLVKQMMSCNSRTGVLNQQDQECAKGYCLR